MIILNLLIGIVSLADFIAGFLVAVLLTPANMLAKSLVDHACEIANI